MYSCVLVDKDPGRHGSPWLAIYLKGDNLAKQVYDAYAELLLGRPRPAVDLNVRYEAKVTPTFPVRFIGVVGGLLIC